MSTSKRGRPTVLNAVLIKRICSSLREGSTLASAAVAEGISERTLFNWLDRGEAGEKPFALFFFAVSRAREAHKANLIQRIVAAAKADWKAASWLLERQFPNEFARSEPREMVVVAQQYAPPPPSPKPETPPKGMERWLTPKGKGIPLDKESLNYLAALGRQLDSSSPTRSENGDGEAS